MSKEVHILLVEDNEGDIVLTREAMDEAELHNKMDVARDGEEALQFLRKEGKFREAITPDLILMDINLPRLDGKEVLSIIKMDNFLKIIPVIMLTTSNSEKDIMESYFNHANCYITKPVKLSDFMNVIHTIRDFWISIVKLPKNHENE
jgi:two-component system, chemotaxis family, response regulator Rcp1